MTTAKESVPILRLVKYLCAQALEEFRFALLRPLLLICPRKERLLLGNLRKNGFVVLRGFYKPEQVEAINREIDKSIRPLLSAPCPGLTTLPGSARFRRPENWSSFFKALSRDVYWILLHAIYNGRLNYPVLMLSFTEKHVSESSALPASGVQFYASHAHFDSFRHEVKVVVALSDVGEHSGPTEIAVASSKYLLGHWREYFASWLVHQDVLESTKVTIPDDVYSKFERHEKLFLSKGDVAIFDARNIHRATPLTEGKRDLLWFYF